MVKLGEFLNLIDNFYTDAATINIFDEKEISDECDSLADDILGFAFAVRTGESESSDYLTPKFYDAEIKRIYFEKKRIVKVLVKCSDFSDYSNEAPLKKEAASEDVL